LELTVCETADKFENKSYWVSIRSNFIIYHRKYISSDTLN